jgi:aspartyl-tRNA(Asn)/glutamyl-tRNA(Gln) amidotransferase subunit C
MKIDDALIDRLSNLARLEFNGNEKNEIRQDMERMLQFIDKLNEIDTTGVSPLIHVHEGLHPMREDLVQQDITTKEALQNAPDHDTDYFRVPRVVDKQNEG